MNNKKILSGLMWKMLERFGTIGGQFVIQIILSRILGPSEYGALAIMMIFITIANVFIQNGFNTSLIQNKDIVEEDYSSVLWVSELIALAIYLLIFFFSPLIANIYKMEYIVWPLRILALMLFPGALNSVQIAKVTREMNFKLIFRSNIVSVIVSGLCGIAAAYIGFGLWALVIQSLVNTLCVSAVMLFSANLKIKPYISSQRVKKLFSFGWKLVVSSLLNSVTENVRGLAIGIKYDATTLGYYNRGMQFPQYGITVVQSTLQSVMLPAISEQQENRNNAKTLLKNTITISAYVIFPLMAGLAGTANSFVELLLTDKWLACVPYMQVYCLIFAFYPLYVCNLQAMNAMGRSDLYLKLEIIKQTYGFLTLVIALYFFDTPMAIAVSSALLIPLGVIVNCFPNKKLLDYGVLEQIKDILPSFAISLTMFFVVIIIEKMEMGLILTFVVQIIVGSLLYILLSIVFKIKPFMMIKLVIVRGFRK